MKFLVGWALSLFSFLCVFVSLWCELIGGLRFALSPQ